MRYKITADLFDLALGDIFQCAGLSGFMRVTSCHENGVVIATHSATGKSHTLTARNTEKIQTQGV
jgi:hypothetical protein